MLKILLIKPPAINTFHQILGPDLGLGYLASSLLKENFYVEILDCPNENINSFSSWQNKEKEILQFDVVGFKTYSKDLYVVKKCVESLKKKNKKIITVSGGPHIAGEPHLIFKQIPELDFAFTGEAEIFFPKFLKQINNTQNLFNIKGLVWKSDGIINVNPQFFIDDLDELNSPAWNLMKINSYKNQTRIMGNYMPLFTSRGCPYACTFCAGPKITGKKVRYHSLDRVFSDIKFLQANYNISHFAIADDNFSFKKDYVSGFCERKIKQNLNFSWDCASNGIRLDTLDKKLIQHMEKAGCTALSIAPESGSPEILKLMKKNINLKQVKEKVKLIKKFSKMELEAFFIIGYPAETKKDIKKTIFFANKLLFDYAEFFLFTPHPGTEIYHKLKKENKLKKINYKTFNYTTPSIPLSDLSLKDLKQIQIKAYLSFYLLNKKRFLNILKKVLSLNKIKALMYRIKYLIYS